MYPGNTPRPFLGRSSDGLWMLLGRVLASIKRGDVENRGAFHSRKPSITETGGTNHGKGEDIAKTFPPTSKFTIRKNPQHVDLNILSAKRFENLFTL